MKAFQALAVAVVLAASASTAAAQATQVHSSGSITGTLIDWQLLYGEEPSAVTNDPRSLGVGNLTLTVNSDGPAFVLSPEFQFWLGVLDENVVVLYSENGPIELLFSERIHAFGANIKSNGYNSFAGTVDVYDEFNNQIGAFDQQFSPLFGIDPFVGIASDVGFTRLVLSSNFWGIAIAPVTFGEHTVFQRPLDESQMQGEVPVTVNPEPGTIALFAAGMMALGVGYRRRKVST